MRQGLKGLAVSAATAVAIAAPWAATAASADASVGSVIVMHGSGVANFDGHKTSLRFSVSCKSDSDNPNANVCHGGNVAFGKGNPMQVEGKLFVFGGEFTAYAARVHASDGSKSIACTFRNMGPVAEGPSNEVSVRCSAPSGTAVISDAVVNQGGGA